jgi:hypothetical protein
MRHVQKQKIVINTKEKGSKRNCHEKIQLTDLTKISKIIMNIFKELKETMTIKVKEE